MKLSDRQALALFLIVQDTPRLTALLGGFTPRGRIELIDEILNQQSGEIIDLDQEVRDG